MCSTGCGHLFTMTRKERDVMNDIYYFIGEINPTFVVKEFRKEKDADLYIRRIKVIDELIESL